MCYISKNCLAEIAESFMSVITMETPYRLPLTASSLIQHYMSITGMLPELDSLARVLEMQSEWDEEALELRLQMLEILSGMAEAYITAGNFS